MRLWWGEEPEQRSDKIKMAGCDGSMNWNEEGLDHGGKWKWQENNGQWGKEGKAILFLWPHNVSLPWRLLTSASCSDWAKLFISSHHGTRKSTHVSLLIPLWPCVLFHSQAATLFLCPNSSLCPMVLVTTFSSLNSLPFLLQDLQNSCSVSSLPTSSPPTSPGTC